jgi:hypothetical protein
LRSAFEAQDAEESWTFGEQRSLSAHIEEGYQQAERRELIDSTQPRREIQARENDWRLSRKRSIDRRNTELQNLPVFKRHCQPPEI